MAADVKTRGWKPDRWRDLFLDVTIPLFFAVMTAAFFALAAQ